MAFDKLYNYFIKNKSDKTNDSKFWIKEIIHKGNSDDVWICFLGWKTSISIAKKLNLLPKSGKIIVYQEPNALVNKNPDVSKELFYELYNDVKQYLKNTQVNVLSLSLGNMHGFYIASRYDVKKFISVLPGPELGRNIWKSCASEKIMMESILLDFSQKKYDNVLKNLECSYNYMNLPHNSYFYIAKSDDYIPSEDQIDLINHIKKHHMYRKISYFHLGHIFSHLYFGLLNTMNKIPWEDKNNLK
ncbi:MAG: hypothetical protein HRU03_00675 [Nanoarchaeales archaeon]|nr:hypothetical protein [Nanoarchaeales archaeon]